MSAVLKAISQKVGDLLNPDVAAKKKERRYLGGLKAGKYFDEIAWPEHEELFSILGFDREQGLAVFEGFIEIDDDNSGEISNLEFHRWLGFQVTKFSERVFGIIDLDGSGFLDFREYVIGVWNFNTYDASLVAKLAYNIFDVEQTGSLDMSECDALLRMVYNVKRADRALVAKMDVNGDGQVSMEELMQLVEVHNYILQPAFDVQRALRQRVCGVKYWERESLRRRAYFSGYDAGAQASWDSIKGILEIKHQERLAQLALNKSAADADFRRLADEDKARQLRMRDEMAARRRRRNDEKRFLRETVEAKASTEAAAALVLAYEALGEELIAHDVSLRIAQRREFWRAFDCSEFTATEFRSVDGKRRVALAAGTDAEARLDDELQTVEGGQLLAVELVRSYAHDLAARIQSRKRKGLFGELILNNLFAMAPTDDEDDVGEPTMLARVLARHVASNKFRARAREQARAALLADKRVRDRATMQDLVDDEAEAAEDAARVLRLRRVGEVGGPSSKWERLWDAQYGCAFWMHWESQERRSERPDVCHACDSEIRHDDALCFQCNNVRSEYNTALWAARQPKAKRDRASFDGFGEDDDGETAANPEKGVEMDDEVDSPPFFPLKGFLSAFWRALAHAERPKVKLTLSARNLKSTFERRRRHVAAG
eukprot:CAMPEP_0184268318 /NCGR_PEP_ID=MMETSP0977-20130417/32075_1 /TAXON_ID=483370 /ORGANISM="non described non described, Strain CCMP2097" /LENGTH=658 /DNA_ID=CAMNT_0026574113 /DNA_START=89 /DNA_END=2062 /DNA_ORIENTATION=+